MSIDCLYHVLFTTNRMLEKKDVELLKVLKKLEKLQTDSDDKAEKVCHQSIFPNVVCNH